jgi:MFS family permease
MADPATWPAARGLGPTSRSAGVLSIVLMGDALLYVVLPVSAAAFGIGLVWVGVLLSANRFVRILAYGAIARATARLGIRRAMIATSVTGAVSTLIFGLFDGGPVLLFARLLWGLSFAALTLICLAYAIDDRERAGARVGLSRAIQQAGPALSLTAGAWLAGFAGPQAAFFFIGLVSFVAVPLALTLPRETKTAERERAPWLPKPQALDLLFFAVGFAVDGVFTMTITLILADFVSLETAILGGGAILAFRRAAEAIVAPLGGMLGDRFGIDRALFASTLLSAIGLAAIAMGWVVGGAIAVIVGRSVLAAVGPAAVALRTSHARVMHRLAAMQTWRDFGAALGPLTSGFLLARVEIPALYAAMVALLVIALALQIRRRGLS